LFSGAPASLCTELRHFDAGTRKINYKIAQADRDTAVAEYEKAIQRAFREVSDSFSQRARLLEQQHEQQALLNALGETYRLREAPYKTGVDSYLSVLVAPRSLYSGRRSLVKCWQAEVGAASFTILHAHIGVAYILLPRV
jgi:outer membrane protein TolC